MWVARVYVFRHKQAKQRVAHRSKTGICGRGRLVGIVALVERRKRRMRECLPDERGHVIFSREDGRDADPVRKRDQRRRVWRLELRVRLHLQLWLVVFWFFERFRRRERPRECSR